MCPQAARQIDISVDTPFQEQVSPRWLDRVAGLALEEALPPEAAGQVSLAITSDDTVQSLNLEFRGADEVTDVLSFSTNYPGHWEGDSPPPEDRLSQPDDAPPEDLFVLPPDYLPPLGEVIISYPQAQRQAGERAVEVERELALLVVHGVLHLMGHDHLEPQETALMQEKEQRALAAVFQAGTITP